MQLYDAHVHLDFMTNAQEVARDAANRNMTLFANTVTPSGYRKAVCEFGSYPNVHVGLGLHPWWINDASAEDFEILAPETQWIGEVGLDFSPKRSNHDLQVVIFERIARCCATLGDRTLSIHGVRSAGTTLDILQKSGCLSTCTCIFHWFSGSTDELWRAIRLGCWFSVNERQASTRRAREQLKLIPADRLLFETDLPKQTGVACSAYAIEQSLRHARDLTYRIRGAY